MRHLDQYFHVGDRVVYIGEDNYKANYTQDGSLKYSRLNSGAKGTVQEVKPWMSMMVQFDEEETNPNPYWVLATQCKRI